MIYSLEAGSLPENWTPLDAIALVKCLTDEGDIAWVTRATPALNDMERLGMLTSATDDARRQLLEASVPIDEDEE